MPKSSKKPVKPRNCKKQARVGKKKPVIPAAKPSYDVFTKKEIDAAAPVIAEPPAESMSGHFIVSTFLRAWAVMNSLDIPQGELTCDDLMMEIYKDIYRTAETFKQPTILQNVTCYTCGAKAPFLTMLGLEPARPITCLKCQGLKNISARVQGRVLEHIQTAEGK